MSGPRRPVGAARRAPRRTGRSSPAAALGLLALVEVTAARRAGAGRPVRSRCCWRCARPLPLALARTQPLAAAVAVTAATLLTLATGHRLPPPGWSPLLAALYLVGRRRSRRVSLPFVAAVRARTPSCRRGAATRASSRSLLLAARRRGGSAGPSAGRAPRRPRRDASDRAIADTLLEHAARGERARIARELHDVVAHHISMIAVQAETARLTTPGMPAEGAKRLLAIGDTARTALTEMRRLLGRAARGRRHRRATRAARSPGWSSSTT